MVFYFFLNHLHSLDLISFLSCYKCMKFFLLRSDLAFIVSFCCVYCLYSSMRIIKKKESKKKIEEVIETWS